jgi:hypothetical protein
VKYVLFYESSPEGIAKATTYAAQHRAWWDAFLSDGTLLMIGPFSDPSAGAMGVFTTRNAAESFAAGDPFVLNGVVKCWSVREWMEAVTQSPGSR